MEDHVEQQEDDEENHGQDDLESLFSAQLEFVFARPLEAVARRQSQFVVKKLVGPLHETSVVFRVQIDVHVSGQRRVLVADHRWPSRKRDLREICQAAPVRSMESLRAL